MVQKRNKVLALRYKFWMGEFCCHPDCKSGFQIEVHHIVPLSKGGEDKMWNMIALCWACHRTNGLHNRRTWNRKTLDLYTWKSFREIELYGFVIDDMDNPFIEDRLKAYKREHQEKFIDKEGKSGCRCVDWCVPRGKIKSPTQANLKRSRAILETSNTFLLTDPQFSAIADKITMVRPA